LSYAQLFNGQSPQRLPLRLYFSQQFFFFLFLNSRIVGNHKDTFSVIGEMGGVVCTVQI
jgi:hypothetical protein